MFKTLLVSLFFLVSCLSSQKKPVRKSDAQLWQEYAAEFEALSYQGYSLARLRLVEDLNRDWQRSKKKRAVILNIEGTVLNPLIKTPTAMPGAIDFIEYAQSKEVEVFYFSRLKKEMRDEVLSLLTEAGLSAKPENIRFDTLLKPLAEQKRKILKNYKVVLIAGDSLEEVSEEFRNDGHKRRKAKTEKLSKQFGKKLILFPNILGADWKKSLERGDSFQNLH